MARKADQVEREIEQTRDAMEARIVELRERTRRRARRIGRTAAVALGVGAAVGVIVLGVWVLRRYNRPPTTAERLRRVVPGGVFTGYERLQSGWRDGVWRRVPPMRLYIGDRQVGEERQPRAWEGPVIRIARAAATAAAGTLATRILLGVFARRSQDQNPPSPSPAHPGGTATNVPAASRPAQPAL